MRVWLGRVDGWTFAFDVLEAADAREAVAEIEGLGYPSVWVPEGGSSKEIFAHLSLLAVATREVLGPEPVLAVEQTAVVSADPTEARGIARPWTADYLELPNYANNWRRLGYGDDLDGRSDRFIDATFAWGDVSAIASRVREHPDAGADHVCVQVISGRDDDVCLPALRELAGALLSNGRV